MIWFAVVCYLLLSPVVCLLVGRGIRERDAERPVEQCEPEVETAPVPVEGQSEVVASGVPVAV